MSGRRDSHENNPPGRTEPTLGKLDFDQLDESPRPADRDELPPLTIDPEQRRGSSGRGPNRTPGPGRSSPSRRGWWLPLLLLLVIAGLTAAWLNQDRLRGMVPHTELNDVLTRAEIALKDGRLDGNDGSSARELFEAARALEPDNDRARDGLRQVGQAEVSRADAALQAGQPDKAEQALQIARELLGGGSDVDRLTQALAKTRNSSEQTDTLVAQAQQAYADGKFTGPDGAGALYQRVLAADAGNAVAAHGLDQVGGALAAQIHKAIDANDAAAVGSGIDQLAALLPNYGELPALRAAQAQMHQQDNGDLAAALQQGEDALRAGHIAGAGDDTALAHFKTALDIDPVNAQAKAGLGQVAQALIVQANAALDSGDSGQAKSLLEQAAALAPRSAELAAARARLDTPTVATIDDTTTPAAPATLTPQQNADLTRMLQQAKEAARRGDIMLPPGTSAYDLYRSALAIDGNNEEARRGVQDLPNLVVAQFNQDLANGQLAHANERLSDLADLAPGDAGQEPLRQRLAGAWLDQADQLLSRGDRVGAAQALEHARKLTPEQPRVLDFAARLGGH